MQLRIERPTPPPPPPEAKIVIELELREARILELWLGQLPQGYSSMLQRLREKLHEAIAQLQLGHGRIQHPWNKKGG